MATILIMLGLQLLLASESLAVPISHHGHQPKLLMRRMETHKPPKGHTGVEAPEPLMIVESDGAMNKALVVDHGEPISDGSHAQSAVMPTYSPPGFLSMGKILVVEVSAVVLALGYFVLCWWKSPTGTSPAHRDTRLPLDPKFVALAVYLGMVVCSDLLVKREADSFAHRITLKPLLIVSCVEAGKLLISFCAELLFPEQSPKPWGETRKLALSMTPVAFIYAANNTLVFCLMASTFLDTYVVWRNMNLVFSSAIWMMTFREMMPLNRLVAVCVFLLGCFCNSLTHGKPIWHPAVWGILASALLSSTASVLNERALKSPEATGIGINRLNILMYAQTLPLMLCTFLAASYMRGELNYVSLQKLQSSVTSATLQVITCQVFLGIVISRVLKYADSVSKTMVGVLKEVLVIAIGCAVVQNIHRDAVSLGGTVVGSAACLIYFAPMASPASPAAAKKLSR
jgi:hypothetical protein